MSEERITKKCPYCAEEILAEAIVCKHCGRDLTATPQKKTKRKNRWKAVLISVALVCACICMGVVLQFMNGGTENEAASEVEATEVPQVEEQANTAVPTRTTAPPVRQAPAYIPGLNPLDITINLEDRGFSCTDPQSGSLYYVRTCERDDGLYTFHVEIYGRELFSVDFIEATALQYSDAPTDDIVAPVFGFIATVPYDRAQPDEARAWVEATLPILGSEGNVRTTSFGGVTYSLYGIPTARTLEIGNLR